MLCLRFSKCSICLLKTSHVSLMPSHGWWVISLESAKQIYPSISQPNARGTNSWEISSLVHLWGKTKNDCEGKVNFIWVFTLEAPCCFFSPQCPNCALQQTINSVKIFIISPYIVKCLPSEIITWCFADERILALTTPLK